MAEPLSIEEPGGVHGQRPRPDLGAFLQMGFRPLYAGGAFWALVSVGLWIFTPQWTTGPLAGLAWHAHEMLWGFIATIAVGFLVTAGATWTGINPLKGRWLGVVCLLWVAARLGLLLGGDPGFVVSAAADVAFFLLPALFFAAAVYRSKNTRNYAVPWLMLGLAVADALFLRAAAAGDYALLMQRFDLGLLCMAIIALLVARRVIPFFAMRAVQGLQIPMHTRSGQVQLVVCALALLALAVGWAWPAAVALAAAGLVSWVQIFAWKPWAVLRNPLLWILYLGYAALGAGLALAGLHAVGLVARAAVHVHVIAVAGFSILIIGMVTRTALGHLGRPLALDASMKTSYGLMIAAAVLRLLALAPSGASLILLRLAALAWMAAFALYLWRFVPMLIRPRVDAPVVTKVPIKPQTG